MKWSRLALLVLFAGCGDEEGNEANTGTCDGNPVTFRVDGLALGASSLGFDLDGHETVSTNDPIGCGHVDASGGVDNGLIGLANSMSMFNINMNDNIAAAIESGNLVLEMTMAGYDGGAEDGCILIDLAANGETVATSIEGEVVGGAVVATLSELPITTELSGGVTLELTLRNVQVEFPLEAENAGIRDGLLGGGVPYDDPNSTDDLKTAIEAYVPSNFLSLAQGLIEDSLDLQPSGAAETSDCDALSATLLIQASKVE